MLWSNWQGAIWRGAVVVVLLWTGLAWTQTAPPAGAERIMIVHENGKATRCRIVESWQLPDRRIAHLLQSIESGEMITIVDEQAPVGDRADVKNTRSMAKRIFTWGAGKLTPPEGSPIPPQLRIDSGRVLRNEDSPPKAAVQNPGPAIVNRVVDDKALGNTFGVHPDVAVRVVPKEPVKADRQVVEFNPPLINVGGQAPLPVVSPPIPPPAPAPNPAISPSPPSPPIAIPQVQALTPAIKPGAGTPAVNPLPSAQPSVQPWPPNIQDLPPGTIIIDEPAKRSWRPGDKLQAWLLNRSAPKETIEIVRTEGPAPIVSMDKPGEPKKDAGANGPFSTAMSSMKAPGAPEGKKPEPAPLPLTTKPDGDKVSALPALETGKPGPIAGSVLPPAEKNPEPKIDPLLAPDRLVPHDEKLIVKPAMIAPAPRPSEPQWPLNSQSALAANSGIQGPVTYVPYPIVTVPQPHQPPMPPDPKLPDAPQLNAFVNAFTPPPMPPGQGNPGQPGMMPPGNPMLAQQQMMYQQMMQQQMMRQAMGQQPMMPNGDPRLAYLAQPGQNPMMMPQPQGPNSMMAPYRQPMPSQGPTANFSRQYQGPMPPNLVPGNAPMQAAYARPPQAAMMQPQPPMQAAYAQPPMLQQASHQQPTTSQSPVAQQIDQLIRTMREAPYPSQREWAAQQLANFEWRAHPQILHAMLMSASQDPAISVRAGCVYCLGRMDASVEPVLGALQAMRNDSEPRVRQEVEKALTRFGQTQAVAR